MRYAKVFKAGNALSVCFGKKEEKEMDLHLGDYVKVTVADGKMVIEKSE